MAKLASVNVTAFSATEDSAARITVGGKDALGKSVETHTATADIYLEAHKGVLKPQLDAVLEQSHANLAKLLASLDRAKQAATEAHNNFAREQRKLFAATTGQVANQQLDEPAFGNSAAKVTVISTA